MSIILTYYTFKSKSLWPAVIPHLEEGFKAVLGNRKNPNAVLVKQENRWGIGIKALRHMQRMIGG